MRIMEKSESKTNSIVRLPGADRLESFAPEGANDLRDLFLRYAQSLLAAPYRAVGPRDVMRIMNEIILDSLAPVAVGILSPDSESIIIDLGTGSGIPALPLAMTLPNARIIGIDSSTKRIAFARDFAQREGISSVEFQACRLDLFGSRIHGLKRRADPQGPIQELLGQIDFVVSRGCAKLPETLALAIPFLNSRGRVLIYSTPRSLDEYLPQVDAEKSGRWSFERRGYLRPNGEDEYTLLEGRPETK